MHINWYYSFLAVAKHLNYRKASEELFISQPTVFKHVKKLEEDLQTVLLEYCKNQLLLTDAGREFVPIAKQFIAFYEQTIEDFRNKIAENRLSENIIIGATPYIANYTMTDFMPYLFSLDLPFEVSLRVITRDEIAVQLENGHIDVCISENQLAASHFQTAEIYEGTLDLMVPDVSANDALVDEESYIKKYDILLYNHPKHNVRDEIAAKLEDATFRKIQSVFVSEHLIRADRGIGYLPSYIANHKRNNGIKVIESKLFPDLDSYIYFYSLKENQQITLLKELLIQLIGRLCTGHSAT